MPSMMHVIGEIEIKWLGKSKKQEWTGMNLKLHHIEKIQNVPSVLKFPKGHWKIKTFIGFDDIKDEEAEEIAYAICSGLEELTVENTMDPNELNF